MLPFDFGGRVAIHPGEALYYIGYSRTLEGAKKTARNLMSRNAYAHHGATCQWPRSRSRRLTNRWLR